MAIKIEKYVYIKMADIYISRIDCTEKNILKVLDLVTLKDVLVEIGDVKKSDDLFEKIKQFNLTHETLLKGNSPYMNVVLIAGIEQFKELVKYIYMDFNLTSFINTNELNLYKYYKVPVRKLIKQGEVDISIDVSIQESSINISLSKKAYNASKLVKKPNEIKNMF